MNVFKTLLLLSITLPIISGYGQTFVSSKNGEIIKRPKSPKAAGTKTKFYEEDGFLVVYKKDYITKGILGDSINNRTALSIDLERYERPIISDSSRWVIITDFGSVTFKSSYISALEKELDLSNFNVIPSSIENRRRKRGAIGISCNIINSKTETIGTPGFKVMIALEWIVTDLSKDEEQLRFVTFGYSDSRTPDGYGYDIHSEKLKAFKDGVKSFITNKGFIGTVMSEADPIVFDEDEAIEITLPTKNILNSKSKVLKQATNSSVTVITDLGHGSGFFISEDGFLLTASHVINDAFEIEVQLNNGPILPAIIIRQNEDLDIALLKIEGRGFKALDINSDYLGETGDQVWTVGTPADVKLGQTISGGIISGKRFIEEQNYIQTDASINLGNSGGPLITEEGHVVGLVLAKIIGQSIEGLSFAIPINDVIKGLNLKFK